MLLPTLRGIPVHLAVQESGRDSGTGELRATDALPGRGRGPVYVAHRGGPAMDALVTAMIAVLVVTLALSVVGEFARRLVMGRLG